MIFIIEGPDGSGKTTLAETISRQCKIPIEHRVQPKTDEDKAAMMLGYLETIKSGRNMIWDRCWYSEMVYGPIMRDTSIISHTEMYRLEEALAKRGAILIHCTDEPEVLWRRCTRRGEDYIKDYNTFVDICKGFDDLMSIPHYIPVVRYSYKEV